MTIFILTKNAPNLWLSKGNFTMHLLFCSELISEQLIQSHVFTCAVTKSCLTLCDPMDCRPPGTSVPGDSLDKNTGVGCHALLQGSFPTQESNWVWSISIAGWFLPGEHPGKHMFMPGHNFFGSPTESPLWKPLLLLL